MLWRSWLWWVANPVKQLKSCSQGVLVWFCAEFLQECDFVLKCFDQMCIDNMITCGLIMLCYLSSQGSLIQPTVSVYGTLVIFLLHWYGTAWNQQFTCHCDNSFESMWRILRSFGDVAVSGVALGKRGNICYRRAQLEMILIITALSVTWISGCWSSKVTGRLNQENCWCLQCHVSALK